MYLNIIFALALSVILFCPSAIALQINNADNSTVEEEPGSLKSFLNSDFVCTSVWPGIGPFKSNSNNHLIDPSGNQLTYSMVGKYISTCQLEMHGGLNEAQCMLNVQMSADFLLESLGIKPEQIHAVNVEVNKNSKLLIGNNYNPIHITIAPFVVSFQNLGVNESTDNSVLRIVVVNQNLASGNLETSKAEENKDTVAPGSEDKTAANPVEEAVNKQSKSKGRQISHATPESTDSESDDSKADSAINGQESSSADAKAAKSVTKTNAKVLTKDEQLKKDFRDVIQNWQNLKKTIVKERDTKLLSQALSGKALVRQTDAIKWLVNNHKYYEMTPGGAQIEKVSPLLANTKYAVYAEVKEKTKYIDESSGQVIKVMNDTYKVNYTIEKISGKWLITDFTLIKNMPDKNSEKAGMQKASAPKPSSEKSSKPNTKTSR